MAIPLHRARFSWGAKTHLDLEWSKGSGKQLPVPPAAPQLVMAEEETAPDEHTARGIPAICWREDSPVLFERFQLRENTEYLVDVTLAKSFADLQQGGPYPKGWPFNERLATVFRIDPPRRWRENADGSTTISGLLRLRGHAGILDLSLGNDAPLIAEVVCRKLGYLDEFRALLDEVAEEFSELLLQYDSPVSASFNLSDVTPETEAALLFQMRHIMTDRNLPVALDEIRRCFHTRLDQWRGTEDIGAVQDPDVAAFIEELDESVLVKGGPFARLFHGYSPRQFPVIEARETADTAENRYVKFFLEELLLITQRLAGGLARNGRTASVREVESWIFVVDEELSSGQWRQVGAFRSFPSNSQVLQKRRGYREILKFDLSLRMSLELPWKRAGQLADGLIGDLRPVSELYEYWCFFLLRRSLTELAEAELPSDGSLVDVTDDGLQVRLLRGKRSRVSYLYRRDSARTLKMNLFYNRVFQRPTRGLSAWHGSYTARFDPDYSIEIIVEGDGLLHRHWLHFDAKYRLDSVDLEGVSVSEGIDDDLDADYEAELARVYRQDDLFKMHTYRDGILSSRGAYILFPGDGASLKLAGSRKNLFVRHPSAFDGTPAYLFPSVGAFDLCPGRDIGQRPIIQEFLKSVLDAVFAGKPYREEEGIF
ncbi:DUF2357 domain-containing protein [Mesorhizobium sp.]|uniref:DUF2357 domain-containing protein n=1 Tax=Mesorhizobium sp. TaxID=1871066 RepID=UPI000FE66AE1|nr:DUF2357 domain-containing protein [Mesorhizobium sp.]RWA98297.1 MAG: DUF2357 domain-containing protein [Mesorhizobium sp.]